MSKRYLLLILTLIGLKMHAQLVINEYSASNWKQFIDNHNDYEDWFEIYNGYPTDVDLVGYYLSDEDDNLTKWQFPSGSIIPANGFLKIWCSGRNTVDGEYYHTNFRLTQTKNNPDQIIISNPGAVIVDSLTMDFTLTHHSRARAMDGSATWKICTLPTPGATNAGAEMYTDYTDRPDMSVLGGFYGGPVTVELTSTTPDGTIHYTLDGGEPKISDPVYAAPITINATAVLKARVFSSNPDLIPGKLQFNTYFINVNHVLPVVSIAGDTLLELANGNQELEPIGSIEVFGKDLDSKTRSYGELNSHGQDSWANDQRSIDWVSRDEFGYSNALKEKFFASSERDEFQRMIFRAAGDDNYPAAHHSENEGSAHLRDDYIQMLAKNDGLALDVRTSERCIVYLNGEYWGVYSFREKTDDHDFTDFYYNQGKYDIQYQMTWGNTWSEYGGDPTLDAWSDLRDLAEDHDLTIDSNYKKVTDQLDVYSLIDYMCVNTSAVCKDWLVYNTAVWRGFNPEGTHQKWGYTLWDLDATFGFYINYSGVPEVGPTALPCDVDEYNPAFFGPGFFDGEGHVRLMNDLRTNAEFEQFYLSRYTDLYNTTFSCENMLNSLDSMMAIIEPEMNQHADRWYGTYEEWYDNFSNLRTWVEDRCELLYTGMSDCYELTGPYDVVFNVDPPEAGYLKVNTLTHHDLPWTGTYFGGMDNKLVAYSNNPALYVFDHWEATAATFTPGWDSTGTVISENDAITAIFRTPTGIENIVQIPLSVYPSVFDDAVIINFELTEGATVSFDLYSVNGERIATKLVGNNVSGAQFISWDLTSYNLASGMYIIKFNADEHTQTIKVIKQ
ncbi:MAG: CotH kinase family protein [Chitinophagales bacterium]|nr:CotH kinase family protein [Bacteroidota bacterium]MBP8248720.1 CotH kinase family protein [Chitinophagales bacterium]MBP9880940.1 CotH kinase family protein [Chitinophagales bacterium]